MRKVDSKDSPIDADVLELSLTVVVEYIDLSEKHATFIGSPYLVTQESYTIPNTTHFVLNNVANKWNKIDSWNKRDAISCSSFLLFTPAWRQNHSQAKHETTINLSVCFAHLIIYYIFFTFNSVHIENHVAI